jgi:hypothetical protein
VQVNLTGNNRSQAVGINQQKEGLSDNHLTIQQAGMSIKERDPMSVVSKLQLEGFSQNE